MPMRCGRIKFQETRNPRKAEERCSFWKQVTEIFRKIVRPVVDHSSWVTAQGVSAATVATLMRAYVDKLRETWNMCHDAF